MNAQVIVSVAFWSGCFLAGAALMYHQHRKHTRGTTWFRSGLFDLIQMRPYVVTPDGDASRRLEMKIHACKNPDILETAKAQQDAYLNALQGAAQAQIIGGGGWGSGIAAYQNGLSTEDWQKAGRLQDDQIARARNFLGWL